MSDLIQLYDYYMRTAMSYLNSDWDTHNTNENKYCQFIWLADAVKREIETYI